MSRKFRFYFLDIFLFQNEFPDSFCYSTFVVVMHGNIIRFFFYVLIPITHTDSYARSHNHGNIIFCISTGYRIF